MATATAFRLGSGDGDSNGGSKRSGCSRNGGRDWLVRRRGVLSASARGRDESFPGRSSRSTGEKEAGMLRRVSVSTAWLARGPAQQRQDEV
jgi:hypothetical protein